MSDADLATFATIVLGGAILVIMVVALGSLGDIIHWVAGDEGSEAHAAAELLPCIRARHSVFPRSYVDREIEESTVHKLLEAAMWAPFHGSRPPWRFVVLGRRSMVEMQELTLEYYDEHWSEVGWADGKRGDEAAYRKWRRMTEEEITGRWGPVSYMIAIVMRRQSGSKRLPEWEEAAATACRAEHVPAGERVARPRVLLELVARRVPRLGAHAPLLGDGAGGQVPRLLHRGRVRPGRQGRPADEAAACTPGGRVAQVIPSRVGRRSSVGRVWALPVTCTLVVCAPHGGVAAVAQS